MAKPVTKCNSCELLGMAEPYPTHDLLVRLADAADILLKRHDYDQHGYEIIEKCVKTARLRAKAIMKHLGLREDTNAELIDKYKQVAIKHTKGLAHCDQCDLQAHCDRLYGPRGAGCPAYPKVYKLK